MQYELIKSGAVYHAYDPVLDMHYLVSPQPEEPVRQTQTDLEFWCHYYTVGGLNDNRLYHGWFESQEFTRLATDTETKCFFLRGIK